MPGRATRRAPTCLVGGYEKSVVVGRILTTSYTFPPAISGAGHAHGPVISTALASAWATGAGAGVQPRSGLTRDTTDERYQTAQFVVHFKPEASGDMKKAIGWLGRDL